MIRSWLCAVESLREDIASSSSAMIRKESLCGKQIGDGVYSNNPSAKGFLAAVHFVAGKFKVNIFANSKSQQVENEFVLTGQRADHLAESFAFSIYYHILSHPRLSPVQSGDIVLKSENVVIESPDIKKIENIIVAPVQLLEKIKGVKITTENEGLQLRITYRDKHVSMRLYEHGAFSLPAFATDKGIIIPIIEVADTLGIELK